MNNTSSLKLIGDKKLSRQPLTVVVCLLILVGFVVFVSASMGQLSRDGATFSLVVSKQLILLLLGLLVLFIFSNLNFRLWRQAAWLVAIIAVFLNLLLFVPGWALTVGDSNRWLLLAGFSFQPGELLKFAMVLMTAVWLSSAKDNATTWPRGFLPVLAILASAGLLFFLQKDTGTFLVGAVAVVGVYFLSGAKWRHLAVLALLALLALSAWIAVRPYMRDRLLTYWDTSSDKGGRSYQINQSFIAFGAGGPWGRGFGQSLQKYNSLPEPIGDSIYAVAGEEFGLWGSGFILLLFLLFGLFGLKLSSLIKDDFGRLLATGIVILIVFQAFLNMGAMLNILPLTGVPLPFISHGGTALLLVLGEVGIYLNITRNYKKL